MTTEVTTAQQAQAAPIPVSARTEGWALTQRMAAAFAASTLVPKHYQGNLPNCIIALKMAERLQADELMVMQNLYVVHGTPAWSAQFLIACFNQCGRFGPIQYDFEGERGTDGWGCRAHAFCKTTRKEVYGPLITIGLAKAEGWFAKQGSKWKTMDEMMLRYRAASWFIRTTAPEIAMGLGTVEEAQDAVDFEQQPDGSFAAPVTTTAAPSRSIADKMAAFAAPAESADEADEEVVDAKTGEVRPANSDTDDDAQRDGLFG